MPITDPVTGNPVTNPVAGGLQFFCQQLLSVREVFLFSIGFRSATRRTWANWTARQLKLSKQSQFNSSFIAKLFEDAIKGHPNNANADTSDDVFPETFMQFSGYDWYTLIGDVAKGVSATPGGIDPVKFPEFVQGDGCPSPESPGIAGLSESDDPY